MQKVIGYEKNFETITVFTEDEQSLEVEITDFNLFLRTSGKLDWVLDECENGEHKQTEGVMSYEEYWHLDTNVVDDLQEFINLKKSSL